MKRIAAIASVFVFVLILLARLYGTSTAQITPLATTVSRSPLDLPAQQDPYYVEVPRKVTPRQGPYVNEYGETILYEEIITSTHREAAIIRHKAAPAPMKPQTLMSPLEDPRPTPGATPTPVKAYLPLIVNPVPINTSVLAIVYQGQVPDYDPVTIVYSLTDWIRMGTAWHGYNNSPALPSISTPSTRPLTSATASRPGRSMKSGYWSMDHTSTLHPSSPSMPLPGLSGGRET